jgi:hypothetical protein
MNQHRLFRLQMSVLEEGYPGRHGSNRQRRCLRGGKVLRIAEGTVFGEQDMLSQNTGKGATESGPRCLRLFKCSSIIEHL